LKVTAKKGILALPLRSLRLRPLSLRSKCWQTPGREHQFLNFIREAIGDAFSPTDAASKASITLPTPPTGNSFTLSYKFEPTAPCCAGDFGPGVVKINSFPWDY